jgi:hypothetical protein
VTRLASVLLDERPTGRNDVVVDEPDDQASAETLDDEMLGDEEIASDGLRAHDLDMVDSVDDRASREEPEFFTRRPRSDHTAQQLVGTEFVGGSTRDGDCIGNELPLDGFQTAEEAAIHLEDDAGHAI